MTEHQHPDDEDVVTRIPPELEQGDDTGVEAMVVPRPGAPSIPMDAPEDADG